MNTKSLTICEQSIQILDGKISMFVGMDLTQELSVDSYDEREGKVLENSRINNLKQVGRFFDENINDEYAHVGNYL